MPDNVVAMNVEEALEDFHAQGAMPMHFHCRDGFYVWAACKKGDRPHRDEFRHHDNDYWIVEASQVIALTAIPDVCALGFRPGDNAIDVLGPQNRVIRTFEEIAQIHYPVDHVA